MKERGKGREEKGALTMNREKGGRRKSTTMNREKGGRRKSTMMNRKKGGRGKSTTMNREKGVRAKMKHWRKNEQGRRLKGKHDDQETISE